MTNLKNFYNIYHKKNNPFYKVIGKNNFTYFYLLELLDLCKISIQNKKILDIGCGVGTMCLYFADNNAQAVVGLDISDRAINIAQNARKSLGLKNVIFRNSELQKNISKFDMVLCSEIIEHIKDDKTFLSLVANNLKDGGLLVLTTPSFNNLLYRLGYYKKFDSEVGHFRRYSEKILYDLLASSGFKILEMRSVEGLLRNILFTSKLGFFIKFIRGPLIPLFHFFDRISAALFGASDIQVVAQKTTKFPDRS